MRNGKLLTACLTLCVLSSCVPYHMPRESEPHATLSFDKSRGSDERPWPVRLNREPISSMNYRRTFRIDVGTLELEVGESPRGDLMHDDPFFTCELSFEAEAGRQYLVSMRWEGDHGLYAVASDDGGKVAECKAQERCELRYGVERAPVEFCPKPPTPGGQGKGEGAIVLRDNAPVYKKPDGAGVIQWLERGNAVVAIEPKGIAWEFHEESGRTRIAFPYKGDRRIGWMKVEDLARFTYASCIFDAALIPNPPPGYPFTTGKRMNWNICFQQARDAKLKELGVISAEE